MPFDKELLTPIAQTPIIRIITEIEKKASEQTPHETWKSLKTFFFFQLPPDCKPNCKLVYDKINNALLDVPNQLKGEPLLAKIEKWKLEEEILKDGIYVFMDSLNAELYGKGYTKIDYNIKPRNETVPELRVDF